MQVRNLLAFALLGGCVVGPRPPGSSDDPTAASPALLQVSLTLTGADAPPTPSRTSQSLPVQQSNLFITVSHIDLEDDAATWHTLSVRPQRFDVLALAGQTLLLASSEVDATIYQRARIAIDSASLQVGGIEQPVQMGYGAGAADIDMPLDSDATYSLVLGFDLFASMTATDSGFAMTPYIDAQAFYAD